jgi:hypothetical protein
MSSASSPLDQRTAPAEPEGSAGPPWEPPILLGAAPAVAPFPVDVLPVPLQRFVREAEAALCCPADYLGVPLLVLAGAALGASRTLEVKRHHVQRPCLYAAIIGPPGSVKTPALALVAEPAHEAGRRLKVEWDRAMLTYEKALADYESDRRKIMSRPCLIELPDKPERPVLRRLTVGDATTEALAQVLLENPRGVVLVRDEITAWAGSMNQYKGGRGADRQFFLSAWSGEQTTVDRKGSHQSGPVIVPRPFLAVIGGLPPAMLPWLRGDRRRGHKEEDGFFDRILFAYPAERPPAPENWLEVSDDAVAAWRQIYERLRQLEMVPELDGSTRPRLVCLTASGRAAWHRFTENHVAQRIAEDFPLHLAGPWSKLIGYCARLALIVHCLRRVCDEAQDEDVDGESVDRAAVLVKYFKSHALKVHAVMGTDERLADARHVLEWLERHTELQTFSRRDVHQRLRHHQRFTDPDNLDEPLCLLDRHGYIRTLPRDGRRGTDRFERNPLWIGSQGSQCSQHPQGPQQDSHEAVENTENLENIAEHQGDGSGPVGGAQNPSEPGASAPGGAPMPCSAGPASRG